MLEVAFWVLLPFITLVAVMAVVAGIVRRRRYRPRDDDYQDWSDRAARQQRGDHFDLGGGSGY